MNSLSKETKLNLKLSKFKKNCFPMKVFDLSQDCQGSLVDEEGFPRENLEWGKLVNFRNLKRKNNELNNDLKLVMKQIE